MEGERDEATKESGSVDVCRHKQTNISCVWALIKGTTWMSYSQEAALWGNIKELYETVRIISDNHRQCNKLIKDSYGIFLLTSQHRWGGTSTLRSCWINQNQWQDKESPQHKLNEKSTQETQTLSAKIFHPAADPFPGVQDRQNLISWRRSLPAPTDPVWWRSMHTISSYRANRHRPPARHKHRLPIANTARNTHTHRQDRLQYTAPLASTQCNHTLNWDSQPAGQPTSRM